MEVVTVEAARAVRVEQTPYGVPVQDITIRSRVSYADLDLKTENGVNELAKRIRETARSTCKEMDVKFPVEGHGEEACVKGAIDGAMAQAKKIVAEKGGPAPK
jgi:UrcA family protein